MSEKVSFIETYKGKGVEEILSQPGLEDDIKDIAEKMKTLDPQMQEEARAILETMLEALSRQHAEMVAELTRTVENVANAQKSTDACLAYLKADNPRKERNDDPE